MFRNNANCANKHWSGQEMRKGSILSRWVPTCFASSAPAPLSLGVRERDSVLARDIKRFVFVTFGLGLDLTFGLCRCGLNEGLLLGGLMLGGLMLDGLILGGLMLDGLMLGGLMLDGLMLDGLVLVIFAVLFPGVCSTMVTVMISALRFALMVIMARVVIVSTFFLYGRQVLVPVY